MKKFYINNDSDEIIIFLNGWGNDENPLMHLTSMKDVLILSDYTDLKIDFDFSKYKKKYLIAYSAGVFMSAYLKDKLPQNTYKTAINGTQKFEDEEFGLTKNTIKQLKELNLYNYLNFRRNFLVNDEKELIRFNKNQPKRTLQSAKDELDTLQKYHQKGAKEIPFDKVLISQNDKILNPENQKKYWKNSYKIIEHAGHFPFFKFKTYEEIINY